jgi:hypothetical protein
VLSLIPVLLGHWHPSRVWLWPMTPGFVLGAITIGVHRNDNLLLYVAVFLNAVMYGCFVFVLYPHVVRQAHDA